MRAERARALLVGIGLIATVVYEILINVAGPIALALVIGRWSA